MTDELECDLLSPGVLPRRTLHRSIRSMLLAGACAQLLMSACALWATHSPRSPLPRAGHTRQVASMIASVLSNEAGRAMLASQDRVDQLTATESIDFVIVEDSAGNRILSSGRTDEWSEQGGPKPGQATLSERDPQRIAYLPKANSTVYRAPVSRDRRGTIWATIGVREMAAEQSLASAMIASGAGMAAMLLVTTPLVMRRMRVWTRALRRLHISIRRMAMDAPITPLPVQGDDQLAYLTVAFNDMAGRLIASRRALSSANQMLESRVRERTEQLHAANTSLQSQNARLAEVSNTALQVTDTVAREFRAPLAVVGEFSRLLEQGVCGPVNEAQAEHLRVVGNATAELVRLVDDALDTGRIRAGCFRVERATASVQKCIDRVIPTIRERAANARVALDLRVEADLPRVFVDDEKAARSLLSLAIDAINRAAPDSGITIQAIADEAGGVRLSVTHDAPNPSAEEHASFRPESQRRDVARCASEESLGTRIAQGLVSLNLGQLECTIENGGACTIAFTMPADRPAAVAEAFLCSVRARCASARIGVIELTTDEHAGAEETCRRLASIMYPNDVAVPIGCAIILFGESNDAARWSLRLLREYAQMIDDLGEPRRSGLRVTFAQSYPLDAAAEAILERVSEHESDLHLRRSA